MNTQVDPELHIFRSKQLRSVVKKAIRFFEETPIHPLPPSGSFNGNGVYAMYYVGDFKLYSGISMENQKKPVQPIYVGKAVPPGWRAARASAAQNVRSLVGRLREHRRSIDQSQNLKGADFLCRFIILDGIETDLISSIEAALIRNYCPVWNTKIDGYGNHDPGKEKRTPNFGQSVSGFKVMDSAISCHLFLF